MKVMLKPTVVVIGSGLSAIGAIKALVKEGIKPTILDTGRILDIDKQDIVNKLSEKKPDQWKNQDREFIIKNDTVVKDASSIPKKLIFGSNYLYGKSIENAKVEDDGSIPPFSYARGGLSAGWGAAILPPSEYDIEDWPISIDEFHKYCQIVLEDLPYSSSDDGLSLSFPQMSDKNSKLNLSSRASILLNKLTKKVKLKKDHTLYGQSRLLVNANNDGCQYCGECMSGCVYKSIYKSDDDITKLIDENKIEYIQDCLVDKLIEKDDKVIVEYFDENSKKQKRIFDKVFLAAGAINSSRIILNSLDKFDRTLEVKTRGGYVVPVFSFKSLPLDWPNVNTQPSLFLEFRGDGLEHWVHTQVASDNELLLKMLGLRNASKGILSKIKKIIANHTYLLLVNYHSEHSGTYELSLKKENNILKTKQKKESPQFKVLVTSWWKLFKILLKIGSIPVYPFAKLNSGSYHVGGTMPMKENPKELETDILGVVKGMKNIHVVDTSTFPSLPGTTIGLMMMANAYRIVDKVFKKKVSKC
jgi:ferredoxin